MTKPRTIKTCRCCGNRAATRLQRKCRTCGGPAIWDMRQETAAEIAAREANDARMHEIMDGLIAARRSRRAA